MKERTNAYIKVEWKYKSLLMVVGEWWYIAKLVVLMVTIFKALKMTKRKKSLY